MNENGNPIATVRLDPGTGCADEFDDVGRRLRDVLLRVGAIQDVAHAVTVTCTLSRFYMSKLPGLELTVTLGAYVEPWTCDNRDQHANEEVYGPYRVARGSEVCQLCGRTRAQQLALDASAEIAGGAQ